MLDTCAIFVTVVSAAVILFFPMLLPDAMPVVPPAQESLALIFLAIWTVVSMPLAFAMPRLQAGFISRMWDVPSSTYLLPRWIVRICIGGLMGQAIGWFVSAVLQNYQHFGLAVSASLVGGAFFAGARPRFKNPPSAEFEIPWSLRWMFRSLVLGSRLTLLDDDAQARRIESDPQKDSL